MEQRYEHRQVLVNGGFRSMEDALHQWEREGWELCGVESPALFFKRPMTQRAISIDEIKGLLPGMIFPRGNPDDI